MTLMAGPIDTRVNPTKVNELANSKPIDWFEQQPDRRACRCATAARSAARLSGLRAARRVHEHEHRAARQGAPRALRQPAGGRDREGEGHQGLSTTSISRCSICRAEFYLETVQRVFQDISSPRGKLKWRGERGRAARDPAHRAADGRRREGRHLRGRPDLGGAGPLLEPAALPQDAPHAAGRRALRGVQRQALGRADLSAGEERHFVERVGLRRVHLFFLRAIPT